uniref:Putative embryo defective protein n=1 Tax=Tanacetum cinerariifolium TaxID=118510 RepID=A0A699IB19_TANCI|nr:putative embryo defective protein [Tanacetum cinerariifolium]
MWGGADTKIDYDGHIQEIRMSGIPHDEDVTKVGSLAIRKLFRSWLTFLPSASMSEDDTLMGPTLNGRVKLDDKILKDGLFERIWFKFWGMDAMIEIPAIIFMPLLMIVNMKYGAQVTKELYPLWISGPLLVALYIKMVQALCSLYVFSFKQSVKMVKVSKSLIIDMKKNPYKFIYGNM